MGGGEAQEAQEDNVLETHPWFKENPYHLLPTVS